MFQAGRTPQKQSKGDLLRCDFHPRTHRARMPVSPRLALDCVSPAAAAPVARSVHPVPGSITRLPSPPNLAERPPLCPRCRRRSLPNPIEHRFLHRAQTNKGRSSYFRQNSDKLENNTGRAAQWAPAAPHPSRHPSSSPGTAGEPR